MSEYCSDSFRLEESEDSFRMWQGLVGPYFQPRLSADGTLSWSNNGGLQNPEAVNIRGPQGAGIRVAGIAENESGLPVRETAGGIWLVGTDVPYEGWAYINGEWVDLGPLTVGPAGSPGPQGDDYELTEADKAEIAGLAVDQFSLLLENDPLPVRNGGTGARTVEGAQTALGIGEINDKLGTWPLGTDAQDVAGAVNELIGKANEEYASLHGKISVIPKPNLLDNWYFVRGVAQDGVASFPINQRGQNSYNGARYGIDRWVCSSSNALVALGYNNYIVIKSGISGGQNLFLQYLENKEMFAGKTVTISAIINSTLVSSTIQVPADSSTWGSTIGYGSSAVGGCAIYLRYLSSKLCFVFYTNSNYEANTNILIQAAKIEIGDTQTLAHRVGNIWVLNEIPNYSEQLARCQRFFQLYRTQELRPTYGADCRPVMASETPTAGTITSGSVTYYTLSSEL